MSDARVIDVASRGYWAAIALLAAGLIASAFVVAGEAFFADDDFRWLSTVRDPDFSLLGAWLPLEHREWWSYRPLAMHTHFYAGQALFGLEPMAFYSVALVVHFAGGLLVHALGRSLGFPSPIAAFGALLAISRPPSMDVIFWASAFSYFSVATASLLAMVLFASSLERGDARLRAASVGAMFVALCCQESAVLLPGVLFALAWLQSGMRERAWKGRGDQPGRVVAAGLVRAVAPHTALSIFYVIWRFGVLAPFERSFNYQSVWGWNMVRNAVKYAEWVAGGEPALVFALIVLATVPVVLWRMGSGTRGELAGLLAFDAFCLVWVLVALLPFVPVRMIAPRFAIAVEVPLCVLYTGQLAVAWRCLSPRGRTGLLAVAIGVLVLAMPQGPLREAWEAPRGAGARLVFDAMARDVASLPEGTRVVLLYGDAGQRPNAWKIRREAWTGTPLLKSLAPGRGLVMSFQGFDKDAPAADFAPASRHYSMGADGPIVPATPDVQERFFRRSLRSRKPAAPAAAAQRLARLRGAEAVDAIVAEARARDGAAREAIAQALLLIDHPEAERAAAGLIPDEQRRRALRQLLIHRWREGGPA